MARFLRAVDTPVNRLGWTARAFLVVLFWLPFHLGCGGATSVSDTPSPRVVILDREGRPRGSVIVRVARTSSRRYRGLSGTESLPEDRGMLFVYDREDTRSFVMRDMNYPLDILFIGEGRRVERIFGAPVPPRGSREHELRSYRARARWVLEVNRGWSRRNDVEVGDPVRFIGVGSSGDG